MVFFGLCWLLLAAVELTYGAKHGLDVIIKGLNRRAQG